MEAYCTTFAFLVFITVWLFVGWIWDFGRLMVLGVPGGGPPHLCKGKASAA